MSSETKAFKFGMVAQRDKTLPDTSKFRFAEPLKFLPVAFVMCVIFTLWFVYTAFHCLPLMKHQLTYMQGWYHLVVFNSLAVLVLTCYFRCLMQHPGTIPDVSASEDGEVVSWDSVPRDQRARPQAAPTERSNVQERKRMGDRRHCKWCNKYKPDRCHHCRVCRMCILKMDHHCPWIYNCVGFKNFKYFFLLVTYASVASNFIVWTMMETVRKVCNDLYMPFLHVFAILFAETLAGFAALLLTAFLAFHIQLALRALTTIEFCEKSSRRYGPHYDSNMYSRGFVGNIQAVLGDNVFLWLLPVSPPSGDGVTWRVPSEETTPLLLSRDMNADRSIRRKTQDRYRSQNSKSAGTGSAPGSEEDRTSSRDSEPPSFPSPERGNDTPSQSGAAV